MEIYLTIIVSAIFTDNFVLSKFLGVCSFLGVSKKLNSAVGMSLAVTLVMTLSTIVTWPIQVYILEPNDLGYLTTVVFILVIAALVQMLETLMKKYMKPLYNALGIYLPLITTNCAVLGVTLLNIDEGYTYMQSVVNSFAAGIGFLLALTIFAGVRGRIEKNDIPNFLKGLPITLIAASIVSVSFFGFNGIVEGILG